MLISPKRYKIEIYLQWNTNRKSYIASQMAQTPVTLNDDEDHFSYLTILTHFLGNMARINFNMRTRIGEHKLHVTFNELDGHSSISELFK